MSGYSTGCVVNRILLRPSLSQLLGEGRILKQLIIVALAVVLMGCAGDGDWTRPGTSSKQTAAEFSDCQSQARAATQRDTNIMSDIMATRGNDWRQTGVMGTQTSLFAAENHDRTSDIVHRCMLGKGFVPGG